MPPRNEFIERLQAQSKERHAELLRLKENIFDVAKTVKEIKKERKPKGRPKKEKKIVILSEWVSWVSEPVREMSEGWVLAVFPEKWPD